MAVEAYITSSLEKIFMDEDRLATPLTSLSALRGETVGFQVVCRSDEQRVYTRANVTCSLAEPTIYEVKSVPVTLSVYGGGDGDFLRTTPGLYPDLLQPYTGRFTVVLGQWRSLWVSLRVPEDAPAGISEVKVEIFRDNGELLQTLSLSLEVIAATLPEQTLRQTLWFHNDCLSTYYNVPVFSEEHWCIVGNYMENAARYGMNMILTPVFTPPLDTRVGGERPTVQLVDVTRNGDNYTFGFERLERYMTLAEEKGIRYFEISHLFTQWGASAAPKIMATVDGVYRQLFGWDTDAASDEYVTFLQTFLGELTAYIRKTGRQDRCYFHVSDEPSLDHLEAYKRAKNTIVEQLEGFTIIDALSNYDFYEKGVVECPIPSNDHVETFIEHGVKDLWTYYCCCQSNKVANRFMAMPSYRNRVLGCQLFKYDMKGFLQWGYNFWYNQLSIAPINPFTETGAEDSFPAGDAFIVYPGPDGKPLTSLRQQVFLEALQDQRALQLLESLTSHEEAVAVMEGEGAVSFTEYPRSASWLLAMRERVNRRISALL